MIRTFTLFLTFLSYSSFSAQAQFSSNYYTDRFFEVFVSSKGELVSIHGDFDDLHNFKTNFIKFDSTGLIYERKDFTNTGIIPQMQHFKVSADDEIIFSSQNGIKIFNFDGELKRAINQNMSGDIFKDNDNTYLIANQESSDCNFRKIDTAGNVLWNKFIQDCKQIKAVDTKDSYVAGLHKINQSLSDPIQFIKYDKDGNEVISKEYSINETITGLHFNNSGLFATTNGGLLIALNDHLDTLWTKQISYNSNLSLGNEYGIYVLCKDPYGSDSSLVQSLSKFDFNGNRIKEFVKEFNYAESLRSWTITTTDDIYLVYSAADPDKTLLLRGDLISGIQVKTEKSFQIYPNPVSENSPLMVNCQIKDATITIVDAKGNKLREELILAGNRSIDHSLKSGLYFYQVWKDSSVLSYGKIIVD